MYHRHIAIHPRVPIDTQNQRVVRIRANTCDAKAESASDGREQTNFVVTRTKMHGQGCRIAAQERRSN